MIADKFLTDLHKLLEENNGCITIRDNKIMIRAKNIEYFFKVKCDTEEIEKRWYSQTVYR